MYSLISSKAVISTALFVLALLAANSASYGKGTEWEDAAFLKDGGIIRGTIIEKVPGKTLKIETRDGNVFVLALKDVERIGKVPVTITVYNTKYTGHKSGGAAFLWSLFIPGGGQFYNDQNVKGAVMFGLSVSGATMIILSNANSSYNGRESAEITRTIGRVLLFGSGFWSIIDAPISAAAINRRNGLAFGISVSDNIYVDAGLQSEYNEQAPIVRLSWAF